MPRTRTGDGTPDSLERALVGVARRRSGAYEAVCAASRDRLHVRAYAVQRDHEAAAAVTQATLVEVWLNADRFDPARSSAMEWLTAITHRRAVDRTQAVEVVPDDVRRELVVLTPPQLQALVYALCGGHSDREVATLLDVPLATVRTRFCDGLVRLSSSVCGRRSAHPGSGPVATGRSVWPYCDHDPE